MSERRRLLVRIAPLALALLLAATLVVRVDEGLRLASADPGPASELRQALRPLGSASLVLVGFDPDLGTYAEVRPTVRTVLAELVDRGATLALVSLTPEGRALALAEIARLQRTGTDPAQLVDLGFVPGAEAALVALTRDLGAGRSDPITTDLAALNGGSPDLALVVGGIDLGPRSWVEQVAPRTDALPIVAIAPTAMLPELLPYRLSGQLAALIGTARDGAAYRAGAEGPAASPDALAVLAGSLVAILVLAQGLGTRVRGSLGAARSPEMG